MKTCTQPGDRQVPPEAWGTISYTGGSLLGMHIGGPVV